MKTALAVVLVAFLLGAAFWYFEAKAPSDVPNTAAPSATYTNATANDIRVDTPKPNDTVPHAVIISGAARGPWYFEASFPASIEDPEGRVIDEAAAQAQSEWMTEEFVPFTVTLQIPPNYSGPATVVLKNDNPSGDPAREKSVSFPVTVR